MERFIKNLVKGAGKIVRDGFRTELKISHKSGPQDLLTQYDLAADNFIVQRIKRRFPRHGILSEESGRTGSNKDFWIIDPIDGTTAFTRGLAQFTVCAAFVRHGKLTMAAVYDPMADELFFAQAGKGADINDRRLHVSVLQELDHAWIAEHLSRKAFTFSNPFRKTLVKIIKDHRLVFMRTGSAQLSGCYTAAGRYDILLSKGLNPWDYAASALIIKEAGGKVTTLEGKPYRWNSHSILAASPSLHKKMSQALKMKKR